MATPATTEQERYRLMSREQRRQIDRSRRKARLPSLKNPDTMKHVIYRP